MTDRELDKQETAILVEGVCPCCESEVEYLTSTKFAKVWKCVNPDCGKKFQLEEDAIA